jgi:hypothetical protein
MALVYKSTVIPYAGSVFATTVIPVYPRLRQSYRASYNLLGVVQGTWQAKYDIINYTMVSKSVEAPYSGRVNKSTSVKYSFEHRVLQSIAIPAAGKSRVYSSFVANYAMPGYTLVTKSTRVLSRFTDQTFIQPSVTVKVTK